VQRNAAPTCDRASLASTGYLLLFAGIRIQQFIACRQRRDTVTVTERAAHGTHDHVEDDRNADVLVYVNGRLTPRAEAVVSVFDAGFVLGDGVWEGLRVHRGHPLFLDRHLDRLYEGAKAIALDLGLSRDQLRSAIYETLGSNAMTDGVHVRLMVTRGVKSTPYQDPRMTLGPATIVMIPEYKQPRPEVVERGIDLFTVHVRRPYPDVLDPKLNTHSKLNDITACIQAHSAGADEALMLDPHGFVATCNSTHFFIVRSGELWTSSGAFCLDGITRGVVLMAARDDGIPTYEKSFSLTDVYGADEAFVTGTFAGVVPVRQVDGRSMSADRPMTQRLQRLYRRAADRDVEAAEQAG
jgi:branched-chain amino acid aminotransferase